MQNRNSWPVIQSKEILTAGHDPIWETGRVPNGYWDLRANRVAYMRWLGQRLSYVNPEDWYAVTRRRFMENYGRGMLSKVYRDSPLAAVKDYMPQRRWYPWLFRSAPQSFWKDIRNRRAFMSWLAEQLGIQQRDDWYRVTKQDFHDHGGAGLLHKYYRSSVVEAVAEFKPRLRLEEWRFQSVPQGFWSSADNRRRYMNWLGEQLGVRTPELWYGVTAEVVRKHHGITLLTRHGDSVCRMVQEYLPDRDWIPWLFHRVPNGFWEAVENRQWYLRWLGAELGFRRPTDWYALSRNDFKRTGGQGLFAHYFRGSLLRAARERYPDYHWNAKRFQHYAQCGLNPQ